MATEFVDLMLSSHIDDHEKSGSRNCAASLGICDMPAGYALMLNPDRTHYYWLRWDGMESVIHWDRWAVYRWSKADAERAA